MMRLWRLEGARQGHYGVATGNPDEFYQLVESHGDAQISVEYGRAVGEPVALLPDDWSYEQCFDLLARFEAWPESWAQQRERIERDYPDEGLPVRHPSWPKYWPAPAVDRSMSR
jgi:hypothetical protein